MQIMTAKTTALRALHVNVVLSSVISRQMLYDNVPYAWHFFAKYYFNKLASSYRKM